MSKPSKSNKDKKKQPDSETAHLIEQQKRQILDQSFTIRKLQDKLTQFTQQNYQIVSNKDKFHAQYEEKIDKQRALIQSHQFTIKEKSNKIYELEVEKIAMKNKISNLQRDLKQSQILRQREFDEYKRLTQNQIGKLQIQLKEYNFYMAEKNNMENENTKLNNRLKEEEQMRKKELADKEREKIQTTDKLRDEMLTKIRDMRTSLLSLKKEQLSTTTRLAVLQNHQLTSELEFQSKQSQKLVFENENLLKKVSGLQKDLEIHKEIEQELAKRAHYSRGIIKKLTTKIGELQQEIEKSKQGKTQKVPYHNTSGQQQQLIKTLDKSLEFTQKKYHNLELQLGQLRQQNTALKNKLDKYEKNAEDLCGLMIRYYEQYLAGKQTGEVDYEGIVYDLKSIRKRKVEEWQLQEIKLIVVMLLNSLATRINKKLLGIPIIPKNRLKIEDEDQLIQKIKFPRISEHSGVMGNSRGVNGSSSAVETKKVKDLPISMASKIVTSNVRDWGRMVQSNSVSSLSRKYKVNYQK